jgi:hypothetical protein
VLSLRPPCCLFTMRYIDGQNNKYSVLNECNRMLKYNIPSLNLTIFFELTYLCSPGGAMRVQMVHYAGLQRVVYSFNF